MTTADSQSGGALPERLGVRIDALDAALREFDTHNLDSLIALRRQIQFAGEEARQAGRVEICSAAESAYAAGVLDARQATEWLMAVMRNAALKNRTRKKKAAGSLDAETGLMNSESFAYALRTFAKGQIIESAAVAVVNVSNLAMLRESYGAEISGKMLAHVSAIVTRLLRTEDCAARCDNDDIAIYLPGEDADGLARALSRIEAAMDHHPFALPDGSKIQPKIRLTGQWLNRGAVADGASAAAALNIGLLSASAITAKALEARLLRDGFTVIQPDEQGRPDDPFLARRLDAVLVDVPSSGLDSMMQTLRGALANRRSVIVALVQTEKEGRGALEHGASEFFVRPVDLVSLSAALCRLARRGRVATRRDKPDDAHGLLIVSEELYSLISMGSALQKQVGCEVWFARTAADAISQIELHSPAGVLVDLRLDHPESHALLDQIAVIKPQPRVILIVGEQGREKAATITAPAIAGLIAKPVQLLSLATDVKKAVGMLPWIDPEKSAACLQSEIMRVMQITAK